MQAPDAAVGGPETPAASTSPDYTPVTGNSSTSSYTPQPPVQPIPQPAFPKPPKGQIHKLSYTHDAMVDLILQEPTVTPQELAEVFGYTPAWITRIVNSDAFQARLAERKAYLTDPQIANTLNDRLRNVAIKSMNIISEKLDAEASASLAVESLGLVSIVQASMKAPILMPHNGRLK